MTEAIESAVQDLETVESKPRGRRDKHDEQVVVEAAEPPPPLIDPNAPEWYLNRELTWLAFNQRVLHEAQDERNPLLERVKFLAIVGSNLNEFFMKRIGGLKQQIGARVRELTVDGRSPEQQLSECLVVVRDIVEQQRRLASDLHRLLKEQGIVLRSHQRLTEEQRKQMREYYLENIFPLVTPQTMDPAHPFPFISNLSLNLLVTVRYPNDDASGLARIKVPVGSGIPRFLKVGDEELYVPLEDVVANNLDLLFPGMVIEACELFRVTRNAITERDEDLADDLLVMIETELRERKFAPIVRLEVEKKMDPVHRGMLAAELGLDEASRGVRGRRHDGAARSVPDRRHQPPRPARSPAPSARSSQAERQTQHLPHHPRDRADSAAASLRVVRDLGGAVSARSQPRPEGAGDQDDPVPHLRRFQDHRLPDRRRSQRQTGDGGGGAEGALRRGGQHPLGQPARRGRHPCDLRRRSA